MGVKQYRKNEHPTGWLGFRVSVAFGDQRHQAYFSTRNCNFQDDRCIHFKRERLKAELQDAEWMAESALFQYKRFVSESHPATREGRGLGFHGMTSTFTVDRRGKYQAAFIVHWFDESDSSRQPKRATEFTFRSKPFSVVWKDAVNYWAEVHDVLDEDRDRILANPPAPSVFTNLRRIMNNEGFDIPHEALGPVFREQRDALKTRRLMAAISTKDAPGGDEPAKRPEIEGQIEAWFRSETSGA